MEYLINKRTPWATYHTLMSSRLIRIDKHQGVQPVGMGDTWQRLVDKFILKAAR